MKEVGERGRATKQRWVLDFYFAAAEDGEWARHAHIERICSAWRPPSLVTVIACEVSLAGCVCVLRVCGCCD